MARVTFQVLDGIDRGKVYPGLTTPFTIGREEGNGVQVNDERVSRYHAKIQEDHGKVVLTDLESTNGTWVNGQPIHVRILQIGDLVTVGRSTLLLGSREEIAHWIAEHQQDRRPAAKAEKARRAELGAATVDVSELPPQEVSGSSTDVDFTVSPHVLEAAGKLEGPARRKLPVLPTRLSPAQAAQLGEMLDELHQLLSDAVGEAPLEPQGDRISLRATTWQKILAVQMSLAELLRGVGAPGAE